VAKRQALAHQVVSREITFNVNFMRMDKLCPLITHIFLRFAFKELILFVHLILLKIKDIKTFQRESTK
jgi:hypothetical protein